MFAVRSSSATHVVFRRKRWYQNSLRNLDTSLRNSSAVLLLLDRRDIDNGNDQRCYQLSRCRSIQTDAKSNAAANSYTAPLSFPPSQRYRQVLPATLVHLSIGSVYVYSMWTPTLTTLSGVLASAPSDWTHSQVLPVFSVAAVTLGCTTGTLGSWIEQAGPRKAGLVGSAFWGGALLTSAAAAHTHSLPLLYCGYGVLGGIGWGLLYLSPVSTVMKWFPDRRGLATGMALSAFGAGAALAPGLIQALVDYFSVAPDFVGPLAEFATEPQDAHQHVILETMADGSQTVASNSPLGTPGQPVVVATEADLAKFGKDIALGPGAYALGTGDSGTAKAMATLGALYGAMGMVGSYGMRHPHPDWTPNGPKKENQEDMIIDKAEGKTEAESQVADLSLPASYVVTSTKQFPLLWLSVFGNATGGLALLSSSKLMITDIWSGVAPDVVTASFATGYVGALGIGMAVGRFGWAAASDYLGRRNTYALFGLGVPIVGFAPTLCHAASASVGTTAYDGSFVDQFGIYPLLATFYGGSVLAITFYGGLFSVLPAYIADLFGPKHSGSIHGKALTAWAASAVAGPMGLAYLRSNSAEHAVQDLLDSVQDIEAFQKAFSCSPNDVETVRTLIDAKTITIQRLMDFVPEGTVDPTPFLYDTTCYVAAGLMTASAVANLSIRPIDIAKTFDEIQSKDSANIKY